MCFRDDNTACKSSGCKIAKYGIINTHTRTSVPYRLPAGSTIADSTVNKYRKTYYNMCVKVNDNNVLKDK